MTVNRSPDVHPPASNGDAVVTIYLDGKPCYILPKSQDALPGNAHCIGEITMSGCCYQVLEMAQTPVEAPEEGPVLATTADRGVSSHEHAGLPLTRSAATLTSREWEIAQLVATGMLNKQIADRLNVSVYTVSTHLRRIFTKLGVRNRTALAQHLMRPG
jgi:DNA-binding CsgD family transcriptional regulator